MSAVEGWVLLAYQEAGAAACHVGGVVPRGGISGDGDGQAGELERDAPLDRPGFAVAACPVSKIYLLS
jgi:hypothetical protein